MSRRGALPITLRDFQQEAAARLASAALDTLDKMARAPAERRRIARQVGCALIEAPTGSGKTVILAATTEAISKSSRVAWFWFAPFAGLIAQTGAVLRAVAPGLRVRDPVRDRNDEGTRTGDVFIATWASVAARRAESRRMRQDDDLAPALDTLVTRLRLAGFAIGAVVDEAHHSFKPNTEAFRFFDNHLNPDLLFCATATPDDADLLLLQRALEVRKFQRVAVSRDRVVAARLNKSRVLAVSFVAHGAARGLVDLNETALRKAVDQHRTLKKALRDAGIPIVPLLLVQAPSTEWTPARVRDTLHKLGFREDAVGVHTADEPDPDLHALAQDPNVEVLIFKMAIATGFDAPRAFSLCALRPVVSAAFGLQVVGRIMRVHPLLQSRAGLPSVLDTATVFLGDPQGQSGLLDAAGRIKAIRDTIEIGTESAAVYEAGIGEGGRITVSDDTGQSMLLFADPDAPNGPWQLAGLTGDGQRNFSATAGMLFGLELDAGPPTTQQAGPAARRSIPLAFRYPRREGTVAPSCLRAERMPRDMADLLDTLVRHVHFNSDHLLAVRRQNVMVERRDTDLFDAAAAQVRRDEQTAINDLLARHRAYELLRVSDYIVPADLGRRLKAALAAALHDEGQPPLPDRELDRALNVILAQFPMLLKTALRRATGSCADVFDAAPLPVTWDSSVPLTVSARNLFGVVPAGLNNWELRFADWLDRQPNVMWWTRNPPRPNAADDWSARIVLPETGKGFYPDFVVCVHGRPKRDGIALAETKERIESEDSAAKSRTEHREYGRALMLTYDDERDRFMRVEFTPDLGRNRVQGEIRPDDLVTT